jgi:hypothetical protein
LLVSFGVGGDNEVQRTMLEIVNQLDGFDARGNIKVLMATNRLVDFTTIWFFFCSLFYCRCYFGSVSHSQYSLLFFIIINVALQSSFLPHNVWPHPPSIKR